ncbi:MAG: sulfurtransferase [Vulcanimicrobiaceae bacterium]
MASTIVSPQEVRAHLDDPRWVVVDCRYSLGDAAFGLQRYTEAHVPGAFYTDLERDLAGKKTGTNGRHPLPDPLAFASFLESLGVVEQTQLVAYDAGGDMFAARCWFLARWIGHDAVAVLDGGFAKWQELGFPTSSVVPVSPHRGLQAVSPQHDRVVGAAFVLEHLHSDTVYVLDARASDRFAGHNETIDPVAGHIPGAINRPFKENFEGDGTFKSPLRLRAEFDALGIDPRSMVHQCGSGVSAGVNLLAMEYAGLPGSRLYAGSWSEWVADPSRPVASEP